MESSKTQMLAPLPAVNILLVDDKPANLIALEAVLQPLGHRLVRAATGEEALMHVLREDFSLILMDAQMPGMDGFQTASLIKQREKTRDIPLMFVSAIYREANFAERGYDVGAVDYIVKPFDPELLRAKVKAVVNEHQRRLRLVEQTRQLLAQERRAMAEEAARQVAESANRLKDEFIAMVSHELRTPLNAMLGWATLLEAGKVPEASLAKAYGSILRNARLQKELVEDLLDTSRIVSGKFRLERQPTDVAALVWREVDALRESALARNIRIVSDLQPCECAGDPDRLSQVVSNLVTNAIKFSRPGGCVEVKLTSQPEELELVVSDSGVGVPREVLERIFEPFWQAQSRTSQRNGGLGLGLPIVRRIVEMHGGTIECLSDGDDRGATFRVRIPRSPVAERAHPADGSTPLVDYPSLREVKVLLVDDDRDARDLLTTLLSSVGARVVATPNPARALHMLEKRSFDVLLSELLFPDDDGFCFIKRVRSLGFNHARRIPAIALSVEADPELGERTLATGFDGFVPKPFSPSALLSAVAARVRAP